MQAWVFCSPWPAILWAHVLVTFSAAFAKASGVQSNSLISRSVLANLTYEFCRLIFLFLLLLLLLLLLCRHRRRCWVFSATYLRLGPILRTCSRPFTDWRRLFYYINVFFVSIIAGR